MGMAIKNRRMGGEPDTRQPSTTNCAWSAHRVAGVIECRFVSLSEALDLTTPSGRALAGMLAVFAEFERDILRDRVKAGIALAREEGRPHGRPPTVAKYAPRVRAMAKNAAAATLFIAPHGPGAAGR